MSQKLPRTEEALRTEVSVQMPMTYHHFNAAAGPEKPLLLFFHGYTDSAAGFLKRALPDLDSRFEILAPNGLFPLPQKIRDDWRPAFSWYFAGFSKSSVLIHPDVSAKAVVQLLKSLGLEEREKTLLGFSQGGFFLPYLLPHLRHVRKMISVGAAYRHEDYPSLLPAPLDAIHGRDDEVIPFARAEESFAALSARNPRGKFFSVENLGHTMNDEARALLKQRILEV
jgi:predicted esterase